MQRILNWFSIGLLITQVVAVVRAFFVKDRYFAWAPYDEIVEFEIRAWTGGRELSTSEIWRLFHLPEYGRENRCAQHLFDQILSSQTGCSGSPVRIEMLYAINGKRPALWCHGPEQAKGPS